MENMFKKTLLALAITGASLSANAGILAVDVTEGSTSTTATDILATTGGVNACAAAATTLGVTADASGNTVDATVAHTITMAAAAANAADIYSATSSVVYTGADACTVTVGDVLVSADDAKYSQEGAAANGLTVTAKQITGIGGLTDEDTIAFTVTGGTVNENLSANALLDAGNGTTLLGVVGNTVRFAATQDFDPRSILELTGLVVTPTAGADAVSISSEVVNTAGVQYDSSAAVEITKISKQFSATAHVMADGIIDVATERFDFENLAANKDSSDTALAVLTVDGVNSDTLVIDVTQNTKQGNLAAAAGELVIAGNFSWMMDLDADADGKLSATEIESGFVYSTYTALNTLANAGQLITPGSNVATAAKASLNTDMTELTIPVVATTVADANIGFAIDKYQVVTFTPAGTTGDAATSLETTTFTASFDFEDASKNDLNVTTGLPVGEWTLNGSVVEVPYIPFGPNTQPIIRHTNTGSQTGDISVRYMVEEGNGLAQTNTWKSLGILVQDAKPGVRNLLTVVTDALVAELGQDKFKVALEVTTNVPGDDVTVYSAAKFSNAENQDRLVIGAFKGQ